ncbi:MAG TPA: hypothetical protein VGS16_10340 [Candidatus Dormibacteraeota bacterium]|nr:hypothetical protein [Candidatus Dormibacteraeota bacterium]
MVEGVVPERAGLPRGADEELAREVAVTVVQLHVSEVAMLDREHGRA